MWLSCFSAQRSVSTKHWQGWLRPRGGRGNPAEEFNPCALSQSDGRWFSPTLGFLKINLIHPLCPITPSHPAEKVTYYGPETKEMLLRWRKLCGEQLTLKGSQRWRSNRKAEESAPLCSTGLGCSVGWSVGRLLSWRQDYVLRAFLSLCCQVKPEFVSQTSGTG